MSIFEKKTSDDLVYGFLYDENSKGAVRSWQFCRLVELRIIDRMEESGFTAKQARNNNRLKNDIKLQDEIIKLVNNNQYGEMDNLAFSLFEDIE
jgi:hypothetical protein